MPRNTIQVKIFAAAASGSNILTNVQMVDLLNVRMMITSPCLPDATYITGISQNTVTLSANAISDENKILFVCTK